MVRIILNSVWDTIRMYIFWILPILLVAAFVEVFVTGAILGSLTH